MSSRAEDDDENCGAGILACFFRRQDAAAPFYFQRSHHVLRTPQTMKMEGRYLTFCA